MNKLGNIVVMYAVVLVLLVLLSPNEVSWGPSYNKGDTNPLGLKILWDELSLRDDITLNVGDMPLYNELRRDTAPDAYVCITDDFDPDVLDIEFLLNYVHGGGVAFVSARNYDYNFLDSIGLTMYHGWPSFNPLNIVQDSVELYLYDEAVIHDIGFVHTSVRGGYFESMDSLTQNVYRLGTSSRDETNFIRCQIGEGMMYLHSVPAVFSNYELLRHRNSPYAAACLAYLPSGNWLFDDYYRRNEEMNNSSLAVLFRYSTLRWAWNIFMASVILFLIFGARRLVRPIPELTAYENDTVKWINTAGAMHYSHRNNHLIAEKRMNVFKHYLLQKFNIGAQAWSDGDPTFFAQRAGGTLDYWVSLLQMNRAIGQQAKWPPEKLYELSGLLDKLYFEIKNL